jgi:DNA-binding LytR/AlgR family response regulator
MKVLIIEDELAAARRLRKMLSEFFSEEEMEPVIDSVAQAVKWFSQNEMPDLVLMDIQLADGTCFEIFKKTDIKCPVIFTTAYDQYAIRAFEVNAIAYLLKPVKEPELEAAIKKFRRWKGEKVDFSRLMDSLTFKGNYQKRLLIKLGQSIRAIEIDDIAYFFTQDKVVTLVTHEAKKYPLDYNLDELENILQPARFFRINRQFIINVKAIREMYIISKSRVKLHLSPPCDMDTAVSAERSAAFKVWLTESGG